MEKKEDKLMRPVGRRVLVEQKMTRKTTLIHMTGKKMDDPDNFEFTFKVLALGLECPTEEVKVGDAPVFSQSVTFEGVMVLDEEKNAKGERTKCTSHTVVYYDDIIGVE